MYWIWLASMPWRRALRYCLRGIHLGFLLEPSPLTTDAPLSEMSRYEGKSLDVLVLNADHSLDDLCDGLIESGVLAPAASTFHDEDLTGSVALYGFRH